VAFAAKIFLVWIIFGAAILVIIFCIFNAFKNGLSRRYNQPVGNVWSAKTQIILLQRKWVASVEKPDIRRENWVFCPIVVDKFVEEFIPIVDMAAN
jgi:hypothetical protein